MMRHYLAKILLLLSALGISILAVELLFRLALPQPEAPLRADLRRGRFIKRGTYQYKTTEFSVEVVVNEAGFVDQDWPTEGAQAVALLVGDSFVQAAQVSLKEGWGRQLQQLHQEHHSSLKILSLGVPGAGIATEFELIKQYAPQLNPSIIYLSFLVDNDIFNNHPQLEAKVDKPFYLRQDGELILSWDASSQQKNWYQNLHTVRWISQNSWKKNERERRMTMGEGVPLNFHVHHKTSDPIWEESWKTTKQALSLLSTYCRDRDIELNVVLTPAHWQVSSTKEVQMKRQFPPMQDWDIENYAYERSLSMLKEIGVNTIDLYPIFRDHPSPDSLYYPRDSHWTKEGHALAAKILYTNWEERR